MSKKRKRKPATSKPISGKPGTVVGGPRLHPDKPVAILALAGMLITGFLAGAALVTETPPLCGPDSGCGIVQNSTYSVLFGLPLSLWGFGFYALVLWNAVILPPRPRRWQRLTWLAGIGLTISIYLTLTGLIRLDAWCWWCLASLATVAAMFVVLLARRPESGVAGPIFARNLALAAAFVTALVGAWQHGLLQPPENPEMKALAEHLEETGAVYYGAYWCPECQRQRRLFGRSAHRLPYVECTPGGRGGMVAFECISADISGYPTWIIDGRRFQQVLTPEELARHSRFSYRKPEQNQ